MKKEVKVLTFSDVHFSKTNSKPLYKELKDTVYNYIEGEEGDLLDLVCITGDYFHEKLQLNSEASKYSLRFMHELADLCESKNIPLRVIKGTLSHDFDQLNNFKHLERTHDFEIIETVSEEKFASGINVLYIPEEYMNDSERYYKDYLNESNKYDYVFFHGTFDFTAFLSQKQDSERHISTAPVFDANQFLDICSGYIIGGHIHTHQKYKDRIIYNGSFSANSFDEDNDHGMILSTYSVEDNEPLGWKMIKNIYAPTYKTIEIDDDRFKEYPIEDKINQLKDVVEVADNVRLKLSILDFETLTELMMFKKEASKYKSLKLVIEDANRLNISKDNDSDVITESGMEEEKDDKYAFILEDNINIFEAVSKFIEVKHDKKIDSEEIQEIITDAKSNK